MTVSVDEKAEIARLLAVIESLRREVRVQRQEIAALREERRALILADAPPELGSFEETR